MRRKLTLSATWQQDNDAQTATKRTKDERSSDAGDGDADADGGAK